MQFNCVRRLVFSLFVATSLLALPAIASALEEELRAETETEQQPGTWQVESSFKFEPRSGAKAQDGSVQIYRADAELDYEFKAFGKLPVEVSYYNRYTGLDNRVSNVRLPAQLVENVFGVETTVPFFNFNKTYFRLGLNPSYYSDRWDMPSYGFRMNSNYVLIYQPSPKLTLLGGVAFFPDTQDPVFPVAGVIYKPNDKLAFNIIPPRPNITYQLTKKLSVFGEGSFSLNDEYEVTFDNTRKATLRYYESYLGAGIGYKINKYIAASVSVGGNFKRRLTYDDSLGKINLKDGMYTMFRVNVTP